MTGCQWCWVVTPITAGLALALMTRDTLPCPAASSENAAPGRAGRGRVHGPQRSGDGPCRLRSRLSPTRDGRPRVPAAAHLAGLPRDRPQAGKEAEASPSPRMSLDATTLRASGGKAGGGSCSPGPPRPSSGPHGAGRGRRGGSFWTAGLGLRSVAAGTGGWGMGRGGDRRRAHHRAFL